MLDDNYDEDYDDEAPTSMANNVSHDPPKVVVSTDVPPQPPVDDMLRNENS